VVLGIVQDVLEGQQVQPNQGTKFVAFVVVGAAVISLAPSAQAGFVDGVEPY
jgi:hypothetical protein